jgi:citrate/tricarballylate utilization protein
MPLSEQMEGLLEETRRQMTICNACRYCEGFCAVFPAMELRRSFDDGDLLYMANLCFECRACYHACPYTPPHEYAVNVPQVFSALRVETYKEYTGFRILNRLFLGNTLRVALTGLLLIGTFFALALAVQGSETVFAKHTGEGAFFEVVPYYAMMLPALALAIVWAGSLGIGAWRFWRAADGDMRGLFDVAAFMKATRDAAGLRYLSGGGDGCTYPDGRPNMSRRWLHQTLVLGYLLDFVSTTLAAFYHYFLDTESPFAWLHPVVIFGTIGGVLIIIGAGGLLWLKARAERDPAEPAMLGIDTLFLTLLFLTAASGLALLGLRETAAMGALLLVHLAIVALLFLTLPYGKFAHVAYRYAALIKNAREQRAAVYKSAGH